MARPSKRVCFVIGPMDGLDARVTSDWLYRELIPKALADFPEFELMRADQLMHMNPVSDQIIEQLRTADLVIANLSPPNANTLYEIGVRHATTKPIIFLASGRYELPFALSSSKVVQYKTSEDLNQTRNALANAIISALTDDFVPQRKTSRRRERSEQITARRLELSDRVEKVAESIASLRINTLGEYVEQLHQISQELKRPVSSSISARATQKSATKALAILPKLYEALGTKRGAQIIVAGAVSGIVALGGWPMVTAYVLTLAVWQGPTAFREAVKKLRASE